MGNPRQNELQNGNITSSLERGRRLHPSRTALWFEDECWSYAGLDAMASRAARGLQSLGVARGDRVALLLPNLPIFVFAYLGALKIGAVVVSMNPALSPDEVHFMLADSGASVLVAAGLPPEARTKLRSGLPALRHVLDGLTPDAWMAPAAEPLDGVAVAPETPAVIVYTSGTTGFPKGAVLSHGNVRFVMEAKRRYLQLTENDRALLFLPLFHCFGQNAVLNAALHAGAGVILQRTFDAGPALEAVQRHAVTVVCGVPTTYIVLLDRAEPQALASVRLFFSAAAPLPREVERRWRERFGQPIFQGYGLTETSPFASYNHLHEYREGSVGVAIDGVEIGVVDVTSGDRLPPGEPGEIVIRGPNVMLGYWNRPDDTDRAIRDGWFHTGDIGRMDGQGYVFLEDRLKDMIIVGGYNVYPAEVENVLYQHPAVAEAAVYGGPDPVLGERVHATVVTRHGASVDEAELTGFCRMRLADFKVPAGIDFATELPRARTGKILKRVLREKRTQLAAAEQEAASRVNSAAELQQRLMTWMAAQLGMAEHHLDPNRPFADLGLTSVHAVELAERLRLWTGKPVQATITWQFSTIAALCRHLLPPAGRPQTNAAPAGDAAHLDVTQLSEEEAEALLLQELARLKS